MNNKMLYVMVAGLAIGFLSQTSALAEDMTHYKVLSTQAVLPIKADNAPMERALSFPIVVERTTATAVMINGTSRPVLLEETTVLPVTLLRTSVAKPHHWPFTFGVWP